MMVGKMSGERGRCIDVDMEPSSGCGSDLKFRSSQALREGSLDLGSSLRFFCGQLFNLVFRDFRVTLVQSVSYLSRMML